MVVRPFDMHGYQSKVEYYGYQSKVEYYSGLPALFFLCGVVSCLYCWETFRWGIMVKSSRTISKLFLLAAIEVLSPVAAQACTYGFCWGAVGFGPDGIAGHSVMQSTAPGAEKLAQIACGGKCTTMEVFNDSCAAIAVTQAGTSVLGFGNTRAGAIGQIEETCSSTEQNCVIRESACSLKF